MRAHLRNWIHQELWDQVPVCIAVVDPDFQVVEANHAFAEKFGEWQSKFCFKVYKGRDARCLSCAAAESFADGKVRVREETGVGRNGDRTDYLVHMVPLITPDGQIPYVIEMSTDISLTKRLEREKREAERLAAVGETVAGLAHGVKNLLMGLEGGVYVFRSGMEKGDQKRLVNGWRMLENNIQRISAFVREFLEFARGKTPQVEMVSPNVIVENVVELFCDKARLEGIGLEANLQADLPSLPMDAEGIHTCLVNLVSNALDACALSDRPGRSVEVSTLLNEERLILQVSDDGCGMDYEVKKRVFTTFFTTKATGKGTGLGLLTSKKIVQEHGGSISFESEPGRGSLFRLEFPLDRLPSCSEAAGAPATGGTDVQE